MPLRPPGIWLGGMSKVYLQSAAALASLFAVLAGLSAGLPSRADVDTSRSVAAVALPQPRPVLLLPVPAGRLARLAELPSQRWHAGHRGVDIYADVAQDVVSPGSGAVIFAGLVAGRPVMTIALDVGVNATLEPVAALVTVGQRVAAGETVGVVADIAGHCAPLTCIHWGIKLGGEYQDPLDWLVGFGPVVLLPIQATAQAGARHPVPEAVTRTRQSWSRTRGAF